MDLGTPVVDLPIPPTSSILNLETGEPTREATFPRTHPLTPASSSPHLLQRAPPCSTPNLPEDLRGFGSGWRFGGLLNIEEERREGGRREQTVNGNLSLLPDPKIKECISSWMGTLSRERAPRTLPTHWKSTPPTSPPGTGVSSRTIHLEPVLVSGEFQLSQSSVASQGCF